MLPAAETDPDVVLMKLDLPSDISSAPLVGLALTEALLERDPNERVLLLGVVLIPSSGGSSIGSAHGSSSSPGFLP